MRKIIFIMTMAATLTAATAKAQVNDAFIDQIIEQLPSGDASEVTQAQQQVEKAKALLEQVAAKQAQADKLKAEAKSLSKGDAKKKNKQAQTIEEPLYAQKVNAYNMYEKANSTMYDIFASNIKELASIGGGAESDANDMVTFAADSWDKASKALKTVPKGKKPDQKLVASIKEEANRHQLKALYYQGEAYSFLLALSGGNNSNVVSNTNSSPVAHNDEDDVLNNAFFNNLSEEAAVDDDDYSAPSQQGNRQVNNETIDDDGFNFVQGNANTDRVIYKVQIAADATPLSIAKLRQICPTGDIINNEQQNGIYRYTIGYFTNYDDAKKQAVTLRGKGVDGAFVVAYKNGVRIKEIRDVYGN